MSDSIPKEILKRMVRAPFKRDDQIIGYIETASYDTKTGQYSAKIKTVPTIEVEVERYVGDRLERKSIKLPDNATAAQLNKLPLDAAFDDSHFTTMTFV